MTREPQASGRVDPGVYTDDYYLTNCHGYEEFVESGGRRVGARFLKALALAGDLRGRKVLDVGCGRGEIVLQAALSGAEAWGIDYAPAAVAIARRALDDAAPDGARARMHVACMDVKALEFEDASFDVAFMMDVVEHLYPHELDRAYDELRRILRPGGLLVLHTSPNRTFERGVYPNYSRRVNQAALAVSRLLRFRDGLFNETMLPTGREFPHDEFERQMHVNEQSAPAMREDLRRHGFIVRRTEFWEPPARGSYFASRRLNAELRLLDFLRFLRPLSMHPPLDRWFCNHIWMTAERA
ncbi:MAG TPA: class I SAM-dependent methyltransferase [Dehalococcoidia bacterium]|nr:class I SAM-dependent methyltransferase [Dehalococcoidia bacterium]